MPRLPSLTETLQAGPVRLRDAAERDIPEVLIAYEDDREMHLRLFEERPPSGAALGRRAESEPAERAAGSRATLTVCRAGEDVCVGQLTVEQIDWEHGRGALRLWIAPGHRGQGLGSGALGLACPWLFARAGLARLQMLVEPDHTAMLRTAARAGFTREGILRDHLRRGGERVDVTVWSRLSGEGDPG
jgi:RimJ/RimL family protein N-acetyltransferase